MVEHRLAIMEIEGQYSMLFDSRRAEEWADLFTEDGVYESRQLSEPDDPNRLVVRGRDQLIKLCLDLPVTGIHLMHVPQITLNGDTATVRVHMQFLSQSEGGAAPAISSMVGYYDVAYVLQNDRWRIKRRVTTMFRRVSSDGFGYPPTSAFE
jgi:hypothetical protein